MSIRLHSFVSTMTKLASSNVVDDAISSDEMNVPYALAMRHASKADRNLPLPVRDELMRRGTSYLLEHGDDVRGYGIGIGSTVGGVAGAGAGIGIHKLLKGPKWAIPAAAFALTTAGGLVGRSIANRKLKRMQSDRISSGASLRSDILANTPGARATRTARKGAEFMAEAQLMSAAMGGYGGSEPHAGD